MHRSEKDMWFAGSKSIHYQFYANVCDITSEPDSTHFAVSEHASSCPPPRDSNRGLLPERRNFHNFGGLVDQTNLYIM